VETTKTNRRRIAKKTAPMARHLGQGDQVGGTRRRVRRRLLALEVGLGGLAVGAFIASWGTAPTEHITQLLSLLSGVPSGLYAEGAYLVGSTRKAVLCPTM
jgi:Ca2+/Na+ antiporter